MPARIALAMAMLLGLVTPAAASELAVYAPPPAPAVYAYHNDDYTVRVRVPGGDWRDLSEYKIRVDWDRPQDASLVYSISPVRSNSRSRRTTGGSRPSPSRRC